MAGIISEGDQVVIKRDKIVKAVQIRKGRKIWLEKRVKFLADELIGQQFGSSFEVKDSHLILVTRRQDVKEPDAEGGGEDEETRDNRSLTDQSGNQKLTKAEIHKLQKQGVSGEDIVEQLIENSATFKTKTDFAQEKYIRKKKKKYIPVLTILRPNLRLVADMYFNRGPMRICNLRPDSLGQLLTLSNVRSGNKMLVVDSCLGLVVASVLERLCGEGSLVNLYSGSAPLLQAQEAFNFTKQQLSILHNFPLDKVATLRKPGDPPRPLTDNTSSCEKVCMKAEASEAMITCDSPKEANCEDMELNEDEARNSCCEASKEKCQGEKRKIDDLFTERAKKRETKQKLLEASQSIIEKADMDGLIVASKFHPTPIVLNLIDFVAPSRPIVIFSQYKQPLLDCYARLRDKGGVVLLKLTETWLREYQILPDRTHPKVNMSGGGGYILTGTKVSQ